MTCSRITTADLVVGTGSPSGGASRAGVTCGFGIFLGSSSAHRYRDIEYGLSHATLAQGAAGLGSVFARELDDVVVRYATKDALVRLTFNAFAFDNWAFMKFDRRGATWEQTPLPGLSPAPLSQGWLRQAQVDSLEDPSGTIDPAPAKTFATLLRANALANGPFDPVVLAARDAIVHLENPTKTNAESADCVSCHLAGQAHLWAEKRGVSFAVPERYVPPAGSDVAVDVPTLLRGNPSNTIMFGYHRVQVGGVDTKLLPSISARAAHETAQVVASLRQMR